MREGRMFPATGLAMIQLTTARINTKHNKKQTNYPRVTSKWTQKKNKAVRVQRGYLKYANETLEREKNSDIKDTQTVCVSLMTDATDSWTDIWV